VNALEMALLEPGLDEAVPERIVANDVHAAVGIFFSTRRSLVSDDRPADAARVVRDIEALIKKGSFRMARKAIASAKETGLDLPDWSVLEARMARLEMVTK
jgi:hypothetical protein